MKVSLYSANALPYWHSKERILHVFYNEWNCWLFTTIVIHESRVIYGSKKRNFSRSYLSLVVILWIKQFRFFSDLANFFIVIINGHFEVDSTVLWRMYICFKFVIVIYIVVPSLYVVIHLILQEEISLALLNNKREITSSFETYRFWIIHGEDIYCTRYAILLY